MSNSIYVRDVRSSAIVLEKIFEIALTLEIKTALFGSVVIIIEFILLPNCATVEKFTVGDFCEIQHMK
jgi:hypothetical protein